MTYEDYAKEVLIFRPWNEFALPRHGKVLDIGSAGGWGLAALRKIGLDAVGLDISSEERPTVRADATQLPFRSATFDGAVCLRTLPHIKEDKLVLGEAARVVRRRGFLLLAVGNQRSYTLLRLRSRLEAAVPNPSGEHYRLYGRNEIVSLLVDSGFEIANLRSCHYLPRAFGQIRLRKSVVDSARKDALLGKSPILGRFGPLLLIHGVRH